MLDHTEEEIETVVEQSKVYKFSLFVGFLFVSITGAFMYKEISVLQEVGWFVIVLCGVLAIDTFSLLIMSYFFSPQIVIIRHDTITFYVLFRQKQIIKATEIRGLKNSAFLSLILNQTGWLICSNREHKYVINKKFFNNYGALIDAIETYNPKCPIDEGMGR